MAATAGKGGALTADNITVLIQSWSLDISVDMLEITAYSDAGVEKNLVGVKRWTATATGPYDATNTADVGDILTNVLFEVTDGSARWTGASAFITSMNPTSDVQGVNMMTYGITGNGTLVYS